MQNKCSVSNYKLDLYFSIMNGLESNRVTVILIVLSVTESHKYLQSFKYDNTPENPLKFKVY